MRYRVAVTALAVILLGCDRERPSEDPGAQPSETASPAANGQSSAPSVIREDVLAETTPPEAPQPQPTTLTLQLGGSEPELPEEAQRQLAEFVKGAALSAGACMVVRGHTDSRGSDQQNLRASELRAALVGGYLQELGVAEDRLRLIALGERRPVAPNAHPDGRDFPEGQARNRRVEIEVQRDGPGCSAQPPTAD